MLALPEFLRSTPVALLREYFVAADVALPPEVDWTAKPGDLDRALQHAVDRLHHTERERVTNDAEHIGTMADEAGQTAIYAVTNTDAQLDALPNGHARALWMFLHAPHDYEHAEQVRYADDRRYGRMWDGYLCAQALTITRTGEALDTFQQALKTRFRSQHVEVEFCDRTRLSKEGVEYQLVQVAICHEGRSSERKAFVDGRVGRLPERPVIEAALTYEPEEGVLEVVAKTREDRTALPQLLTEHLVGVPFGGERLRLRRFTLSHLRKPMVFATDPEDNIEMVRVNLLRLMSFDTQSERLTLECMGNAERSVWDVADDFGEQNPLRRGCLITQVRLTIRFRPVPGVRGKRTLPVTISMPQGCDLKARTARGRLIGDKYLRRWSFLSDV